MTCFNCDFEFMDKIINNNDVHFNYKPTINIKNLLPRLCEKLRVTQFFSGECKESKFFQKYTTCDCGHCTRDCDYYTNNLANYILLFFYKDEWIVIFNIHYYSQVPEFSSITCSPFSRKKQAVNFIKERLSELEDELKQK